MWRYAAIVFVWIGTGSFASACDCPLPASLKTPAERLAFRLERSAIAATLRIEEMSLRFGGDGDPIASAKATVVQVLRGKIGNKIDIRTRGGDEAANCGLASSIFSAISQSKLLSVQLFPAKDQLETYEISSCGFYDLDRFGSASGKSNPRLQLIKQD